VTAVTRAKDIRQSPELNSGGLLNAEIERFLAYKLAACEFVRQTAHNSRLFLKHLPKVLGDIAPAKVSADDAQMFYDTLRARMKEGSAQTYVAHARSFFRWAVDVAHLCRTNPFDSVKMPELVVVARKQFCTSKQRDQLLKNCQRDDLKFVLYCGFHAGLRRNEIVEARPSWFDLTHKLLNISKVSPETAAKTGLDPFDLKDQEERTVPLSKDFVKFLKGWLNSDDDYCLAPGKRRGKSRYRYDFIRFFRESMDAQGWPWVTPHTMRRTFGSLQATKGTSLLIIAQWLGDDYDTARKHYGHLAPGSRDA
jgi:integrase